ncbi:uncharacterized protein BYT42DRAFT_551596 [Radiomyces spectabilis]|uniref:uncharacterized protein n=1 Tax=Radiomyces spectabilis TaxID=64574 RepID=UPI00221E7D03|nr:uncharacterized protein BYT42DRAFT_551596 [Radiomyces spectabilis]KAI8393591.1 hypothetical protein BYT42DRAFT_551596 [Radiomyces spectabilis]
MVSKSYNLRQENGCRDKNRMGGIDITDIDDWVNGWMDGWISNGLFFSITWKWWRSYKSKMSIMLMDIFGGIV